jgi:BirA family biotin operon repressor/biotin-[acetyl-CoA-carboxylase] ligase
VYATLVKPYIAAELLPTLPLLVGVGLCRALTPHLPAGCRLKWPNDLLVPAAAEEAWERPASFDIAASPGGDPTAVRRRGRKIGGILIEALVHPDGCVALIGFGVNHGHRPEDLPPGATSLLLENGADASDGEVISLADLTWELVAGVERELEHAGDSEYAVEAYRELSIHEVGEPMVCRVGDSETTWTFLGFDEAGRLRLGRPAEQGGDTVVSAGEVIEP